MIFFYNQLTQNKRFKNEESTTSDPRRKYEDEEEESNISSSILLKSNEESTCFRERQSQAFDLDSIGASLGVGIFVQPSIFYHIGYVSGSAIVIFVCCCDVLLSVFVPLVM